MLMLGSRSPFSYDRCNLIWNGFREVVTGNVPTAPAAPKDVKWNASEAANQLSWDDLRIIKTLSECGNRAATAKKLGINVSTVSRRVSQLKRHLA